MSDDEPAKLKPFPRFETDEEAERFVDEADLSEYDFSGFRPVRFELRRKDRQISIRLPEDMLAAVKERARKRDIPYQRFIREAIERALAEPTR
ncbi:MULTISPECIES: BrnA antitoxin family protein [unclassified Roseitalea]|uniref:BrnA antitoxin family protein n=1 Tax=unclassified Roseitalea TaxID=2639107 RepID=UPI00273F21EB|nr:MULTISPECIES: BrnA antitoxin family protein [unclassified Roseitalea]